MLSPDNLSLKKNWLQCQELQMLITIYYQITVTADMFVLLNFQKCKKKRNYNNRVYVNFIFSVTSFSTTKKSSVECSSDNL